MLPTNTPIDVELGRVDLRWSFDLLIGVVRDRHGRSFSRLRRVEAGLGDATNFGDSWGSAEFLEYETTTTIAGTVFGRSRCR